DNMLEIGPDALDADDVGVLELLHPLQSANLLHAEELTIAGKELQRDRFAVRRQGLPDLAPAATAEELHQAIAWVRFGARSQRDDLSHGLPFSFADRGLTPAPIAAEL